MTWCCVAMAAAYAAEILAMWIGGGAAIDALLPTEGALWAALALPALPVLAAAVADAVREFRLYRAGHGRQAPRG